MYFQRSIVGIFCQNGDVATALFRKYTKALSGSPSLCYNHLIRNDLINKGKRVAREEHIMKLKSKILILSIAPIVLMGILIFLVSSAQIREAMEEQNYSGMRATAISVLNIYDYGAKGNYRLDENGNFKKGNTMNLSQNTDIVDSVKDSNMEVTVYYGTDVMLSSLADVNGERLTDIPVKNRIMESVLVNGQGSLDSHIMINGEAYMAYYQPIINLSTEPPVGMIMIARRQEDLNSAIHQVQLTILLVTVGMGVLWIIAAILVVGVITKTLNKGVQAVDKIAHGDLTVEMGGGQLRRRDEIGVMSRSISGLREELVRIVSVIQGHSATLIEAASRMQDSALGSAETVGHVERAVQEIAVTAGTQARETQNATGNVTEMGQMVEETKGQSVVLNENAAKMRETGRQASETLSELNEINEKAREAIETIYHQTNMTNESAEKIREASQLITSIAEETGLLSLNATIEAARAGDTGRGFAVVATQIQKLSEQTNSSAKRIEDIVAVLIENSNRAVGTMDQVKEIMNLQGERVRRTDEIFTEVQGGIESSMSSINEIHTMTQHLDEARISVEDIVQNLSAIAEENAASSEETSESTVKANRMMAEIAEDAEKLNMIANDLNNSMKFFHVG